MATDDELRARLRILRAGGATPTVTGQAPQGTSDERQRLLQRRKQLLDQQRAAAPADPAAPPAPAADILPLELSKKELLGSTVTQLRDKFTQDFIAQGLSPEEASSRASIEQLKQRATTAPAFLAGVPETALTLGTGFVSTIAGGLIGAGATPFVGAERGAEILKSIQQAGTFKPRSEFGQQTLGAVGKIAEQAKQDLPSPESVGLAAGGLAERAGFPEAVPAIQTGIEFGLTAALELIPANRVKSGVQRANRAQREGQQVDPVADILADEGIRPQDLSAEQLQTLRTQVDNAVADAADRPQKGAVISPEEQVQQSANVTQSVIDEAKATPPPDAAQFSPLAAKADELEKVSKLLKKGSPEALFDELQIDRAVLDSADALGITDFPAISASQSRAIVEAAQASKFQKGGTSEFKRAEDIAIEQTVESANKFIADLRGGELGPGGFDQKLQKRFTDEIDKLAKSSEQAYAAVNHFIPKNKAISIDSSVKFIDDKLAEFGGDKDRLNKSEKELMRFVDRFKEGETTTYAGVDSIRRDIGRQMNGEKTRFSDDAQDKLAALYSVLSQDQKAVARLVDQQREAQGLSPGALDSLEAGQGFIVARKELERAGTALLGRDLEKSIIPQLKTVANQLPTGNLSGFDKMMKNVPDDFKQEVAVLVIDQLFQRGAQTASGLSGGFVKAFNALNRNPKVRDRLLSFLPKEQRKTFNNIGRVWSSLIQSKALENNSKSARDIIAALDDGSLAAKAMGGTGILAAEAVLPGSSIVLGGGALLKQLKKPKDSLRDIDNFITSREFNTAIKDHALGRQNIDKKLARSEKFKAWKKTLTPDQKKQVDTLGFVPFLLAPAVPQILEQATQQQQAQ